MANVRRWGYSDATGMQEKEEGGWVLHADIKKAIAEAAAEAYEAGKKEQARLQQIGYKDPQIYTDRGGY